MSQLLDTPSPNLCAYNLNIWISSSKMGLLHHQSTTLTASLATLQPFSLHLPMIVSDLSAKIHSVHKKFIKALNWGLTSVKCNILLFLCSFEFQLNFYGKMTRHTNCVVHMLNNVLSYQ